MVDQTTLKNIEDLHRLKSEGVITEADFERAKERLLFGVQPGRPAPAAPPTAAPIAGPWDKLDPRLGEHIAWIVLPLRRYADFTGRSSRKEFWMFQLLFLGLFMLGSSAVDGLRSEDGGSTGGSLALLGAVIVAALGLVVPQIAVQVRRLHDQNRPGTFALINLVPYAGAFVLFAMMLIEGTPGDNQYGPDPKAAVTSADPTQP